jgi:hypothetical protein
MADRTPGVVSVVLVNFRGADDTITAIEALRATDWPNDRLEIIDGESRLRGGLQPRRASRPR